MRLVGISLLALLLVGAVVALSLMDGRGLATAALRHVSEPATLRFEVPTGIALEETADASHRAAFHFNQTRPVILSGLPSYQSIRFPLPRDVQVLSGRLRVVLTAQAIAGAEAALRVQIGGSRRGEMLLKTGVHRSDFEIVLTPEDLVGDAIKVSFSLVGRGPTGPCDAAAAMATSVEIEPETALDLTLTGPLETARDRVASWGGIARIGWPEWLKPEEQVRRPAVHGSAPTRRRDSVLEAGRR
ncbi:MAG: cellulose biosynthesis cyclic di-GMP-binding regulatory protein BcsB [Pseudomonadota bacterium]